MTVNVAKLAEALSKIDGGINAIDAVVQRDFPDATVIEIAQAMEIVAFEAQQYAEERQRDADQAQRHLTDALLIHAGLPEDIPFEEACKIKAARGDRLAQSYLDRFNSRPYRVRVALTKAAVERHPGWLLVEEGVYRQLDPTAPDIPELIDWFQTTFPREAKAIDAEIERSRADR